MLKKISKILQQIIGRAKKKSKSKRKIKSKKSKMLEIGTPLERSYSDQHYHDLKKHGPIFVSTNSLSSADFSTYLETSDIIESTTNKTRKSKRVKRQSSLKIKKTREELFEVSTMDETEFKQTLVDNDADNSSEIRKLDLSKSIEELMRYFDKDVNPDDFDNTPDKSINFNKIKVTDLVKELEKDTNTNQVMIQQVQKPTEIVPVVKSKTSPNVVDDKSMYLRTNVPIKPRRMRRQTQVISAPLPTIATVAFAPTRNSYDEYKKMAKDELTAINSKKNISAKIRAMAELFDHKLSPLKPTLKSDQKLTQNEKMKKLTIQHVEMPQIDSCTEETPIPQKRTVLTSGDAPKPRPRSKCLDRYDFGNKLSIFKGQREPENVTENKEPEEKSKVSKIIQSVESRCSPNTSLLQSASSLKNTKLNKSCSLEIPAYQKCIEQLKQINSNDTCNDEPKVTIIKPNGILKSTSKVLDVVATEASYLVNKKHDNNTIHRNTNIVQNKSKSTEILCNPVSKMNNEVHEDQDNDSKYDTTGCLIHDETLSKISVKEKISLFNKFVGEISNSTKHQQSCSNNSSQDNQQKQSKLPKNQVIKNINKVIADLKTKLTEPKRSTSSNTIVNKSSKDRHITSITVNLQPSQNSTMATTTTEITDSISHLDCSFLPHLQAINSTNHLTYALEDTVSGPISDSQIDMDSLAPSKLMAEADTIVEPFGNSTIANMDKQTLSELLTQSIEINEESKDDSQKRNNKSLCGCIPFDVYGPPRKIRRTALERSGIFVNQQLESMFYEWLIEYNNKSASQSTPKRKETKVETMELQTDDLVKETMKVEATELEADDQQADVIEKEEKSLTTDQVLAKDENTKVNESSPKKQSLRRSLRWKIDEYIIEKSTPPPPPDTAPPQLDMAPPSFEIMPMKTSIKIPEEMPHNHPSSEDDGRYSIASSILSKCQLFDNDSDTARRRSFIIGAPVNNRNGKLSILDAKNDQLSSLFEVDAKLLKKCQSPDQFKKAYILTVLSSPSPSLTSDGEHFNPESFKYNHLKDSSLLSRSWSHLPSMEHEQSKLADTLSTTAGDIPASPYTKSIRSQQSQSCQNLINESSTLTSTINDFSSVFADKSFINKSCQLPSLAEHIENETIENNSNRIEVDFVSTTNPSIKEVRFSDSDSTQENKPVKQIIKYRKTPKKPSINCGKPKTMTQLFATPVKKQISEEKIITIEKATGPMCNSELCKETRDTSVNNTALHMDLQTSNILNQYSKFWVISTNCILKFTIYYVQSKELNELKEIFDRESSKSSKINFGVDSVHYFSKQKINISFGKTEKYSKYWFAVGNHIVSFNGNFIPEPQIHQAFQLLRGSDLRFGIDTVEFSTNNKTLNKNDASLARASIYSKTSDLAPSDFESDSDHHELKNIFGKKLNQKTKSEHRLSSSTEDPPSSEAVSPDSGEVLTSEPDDEHVNFYNEGDPLDNLFTWIKSSTDKVMQNMIRPFDKSLVSESDEQQSEAEKKAQEEKNKERRKMKNIKIGKISSDAFNRLLTQREEILKLQKQLRASKFKSFTTGTTFSNLAEANTPYEHLKRLQNMVKAIEFIASSDGYVNCSRVQLESFIYALCKHADLCLLSCITQINKILQIIVQLEPPENELQKSHDSTAALSEHQLRVQASLQRLNIPDWYRAYSSTSGKTGTETIQIPGQNNLNIQTSSTTTTTTTGGYKPGSFTRKRASDSGRWAGLNSKTTSLSSLGSQRSDRSPLLLSPSAHSHHGTTTGGCQTTGSIPVSGGFSRWSTSYLNSTQTSPSVSQRGSFSRGGPINSSFSSVGGSGVNTSSVIRSSFRQPYMGWRSQEKINQPRTPHERLASSLLSAKPPKTEQVAVTPEIQSSIKEVTSAIVHHFNDQNIQPTNIHATRSRSTSPNSRKCWLESSFVGVRPLESPQTPTIETNTFTTPAGSSGLTTVTAATTILTNQQQQQQSQYLINNEQQQRQPTIYDPVSTFRTHINTPQRYQQQISQQQQQQQQYHQQPSDIIRINGVVPTHLGALSTALERSPSSASLEDVLASLLGLPPNDSSNTYRSTGDTANELVMFRITNSTQNQQQQHTQQKQPSTAVTVNNLQVDQQGRFRRRSEGDAQKQKQQQQQKIASANAASAINAAQINSGKSDQNQQQQQQQIQQSSQQQQQQQSQQPQQQHPPRRVSLDSSESKGTTSDLLIKCRNTKCDNSAVPVDARKYYKSCHNCSHLYCSRECRRAHWEKHRKACLHSRVSNLCRQVLSACKDDTDSLRHLSLLARKGYLAQGRGVVRILFRSPESAEGFIKNGFQCMGEASYVRWPDLMPAEMGLELYSELLRLSTEYKPDTKMLIYVAICVVSEAPGTATAPVKWERQLVSRCAKLKLCKTILSELAIQQDSNQQNQIPTEPSIEILILTFDCQKKQQTQQQKEIILQNIINVLNRKGVILKKHYPEIYQRLQNYTEGQTERFLPVTLHPRDSTTGQGFVCIIMPTYNETDIQLPTSDIGNRVTTIDIGEELLES